MSMREEARRELEGRWSFEVVDGRVAVRDVKLIRSVLDARAQTERQPRPLVPLAVSSAAPSGLY